MAIDTRKKRTYASNALLTALFVVGAIVVVNLLSTRVFGRLDLTENKVYTLSQPSKDLVKTLPDYMSIKVFSSPDLPPELKMVDRYVRDLVDEYKSSSNGKLSWQALETGRGQEEDKKVEEEANRCRVQRLQIQAVRSQKLELGTYYLGLCLEYGGKTESIPQIVRTEGLEYELSSLIKKMTTKKKKVAFTTGHGEHDMNQGFQALKQALEAEFDVSSVNPSSAEIATDVDALVVGGPKQAFDEKGQKEIDKFLMAGKGVVFLVDGMAMQAPGGMGGMGEMQLKMGQNNEHGLSKLLEAYGFKIGQDFVFDRQNVPGPIDLGGGRRAAVNAPWFVVAEIVPSKEHIVAAGYPGAVFPFSSSVELTGPLQGGKTPANAKLWKLASSSERSWKHTGMLIITPSMKIEETKDKGPFALGYIYQGPLKSAFVAPQPANVSTKPDPNTTPSESRKPVRLVVVGDSDFGSDEYIQMSRMVPVYGAGPQLLLNAIAWTVEDEALVPLRSKALSPRPLRVESEGQARALQIANIVGLPLAFCAFGVFRWRVRRAQRLGQKL
jgi:gliding-associated putative ABC transporter substrate-binding component GldG